MNYHYENIRPLTTLQYDGCKQNAIKRIQKRTGDKPERSDFEREFGETLTILDWLALVIFVAALIVSSVHIMMHMGAQSAAAFNTSEIAGIRISGDVKAIVHQLGYIALAEAAMLLFLTMWAMERNGGWQRNVKLALAMIAMIFVFVANFASGIGLLESVMPPLFTIGIGFHLEKIIVRAIERRQYVTDKYMQAMDAFEKAQDDPTKHPDYQGTLRQEIWQKLVSKNKEFADAPAEFKVYAVQQELKRDEWAFDANIRAVPVVNPTQPPQKAVMNGHSPN
jgi:hypothetical protein